MSEWAAWLGRKEQRQDVLSRARVDRWCATLDRAGPINGMAPQGTHWILCTPDEPTAALGTDGHPRRDDAPEGFLPPLPLPRRMWAASKVSFLAPLRLGEDIARRSRVVSIAPKLGGSGQLVFVEVEHEILCGTELAVREVQSLVYREAPPPGAPPVPPPSGPDRFDPAPWDAVRTVTPAEPLLFRFSALTFNSHRIHYDRPWATEREGYPALVVHGPLTSTLLIDFARDQHPGRVFTGYETQARAPLFDSAPFELRGRPAADGRGAELWAVTPEGTVAMSARAELA